MIRVADYIAQALVAAGVHEIFLITGGGAMHLNDAIGRCEGLSYHCCHHEQACAMAAEAYARVTGRIGAVNVTTGPGGINALNGVFGAYTDSVPMIVVSGQVKKETCLAAYDLPGLRQLGDQEANIIPMVEGITKYAVVLLDPQEVKYHLEKALYLAVEGRPGPVWLDVPVDVQGAMVDPTLLRGFDPAEVPPLPGLMPASVAASMALERLNKAQRPIILAGYGVHAAGAESELLDLAERLQIPVAAAWTGTDLVPNDHPCYAGRPGTVGERAGNFNLQNSDCVLMLGCRANIRQVSYAWQFFAREAELLWVDIDPHELDKPTVRPHIPLLLDARDFLQAMLAACSTQEVVAHEGYLEWCRQRVKRFSAVTDEHRDREDLVSGYAFIEALSDKLGADDCIVTANGAASVMLMQAVQVKTGQRILGNSGSASMGYDLPAAIGACIGRGNQRVMCLAGDGSIMMNLQELQTIVHHQLPIKIFVWNNGLYLSIRTTQNSFFGGALIGEGRTSGVSAPDFLKLAQAFGIPAMRVANMAALPGALDEILAHKGPYMCELMMPENELMLPKTSSMRLPDGRMISKPLEDMFPFLAREEFAANMLITPLEEPS